MMKTILLFALTIAAFGLFAQNLKAQFTQLSVQNIDKPVIVELFTSQSCSSCPPADQNLAALAENPNIIPLSFHVTYWNHLHWEDTLSREFSTQRQRNYSRSFGNGRVYTPQMVVNGRREFVGSNRARVNDALNQARSLERIDIQKDGEALAITLPTIESGEYDLWIAGVKNEHTQSIPSGENRGRTVTYKNAVLTFQSGGAWDGSAQTKTVKIKPSDRADHYVILAQKIGYGSIVASGITH